MRVRIMLIVFAVAVVTLFSSFNPPVRCRAILLQAAGPGLLLAAAPTPPAIPKSPCVSQPPTIPLGCACQLCCPCHRKPLVFHPTFVRELGVELPPSGGVNLSEPFP